MRIFLFIRLQVFMLLLLGALPISSMLAQDEVPLVVDQNFSTTYITPRVYKDSTRLLTIEQAVNPGVPFALAASPYLTFGADQGMWWLNFKIKNELKTPKTLILWLNRKNFDAFKLWQLRPDSTLNAYDEIGARFYDEPRFALTTGYYIAVTLMPGQNTFWAKASNEVGSMYLALSLHTPEGFGLMSRKNVLLFGLFLGVMLVSLVFAGQLFVM
jgi:hypothetical protein